MRTITFPRSGVEYSLWAGCAISVFPDGHILSCIFDQGENDHYRSIAHWAGYSDHRLYAIHHDLTHHWLAECHGCVSYALYRAAIGQGADHDTGAEEHLVNGVQRLLTHQELTVEEVKAIITYGCMDFSSLLHLFRLFR